MWRCVNVYVWIKIILFLLSIFTKAYLVFEKKGYWVYITSNKFYRYLNVYMYKCALSPLRNWHNDTTTKREKKNLLPFATVGIRYHGVPWMRLYMCEIYKHMYIWMWKKANIAYFPFPFPSKCDFYFCKLDVLLLFAVFTGDFHLMRHFKRVKFNQPK